MRTSRLRAITLAVVAGILTLAPTVALAQQDQAQAATQVTVDLTALNRGDHHEALAQTGDESALASVCVAAAGAAATCLGLYIKRSR